jgi:hypothetical protein
MKSQPGPGVVQTHSLWDVGDVTEIAQGQDKAIEDCQGARNLLWLVRQIPQ